jgi:hypothetical protein
MDAWFVSNVPQAQKSFWMHPMELLGDVRHRESHFGPFRTVLVSVQDSCMVCVMRTLGLEIILDTPDGTPGVEAQVDARFSLFGDIANLDAR